MDRESRRKSASQQSHHKKRHISGKSHIRNEIYTVKEYRQTPEY